MALALPSSPPAAPIHFGAFEVDLWTAELKKDGRKVHLEGQPFEILRLLIQHPGQLITREDLQHRLWPADTFVDFETGINAAVRRLRQALGDPADAPQFIETLPRRGYRFIYPIETASAVSSQWGRASHLALLALLWASLAVVAAFSAPMSVLRDRPVRSIAVLPFQNLTGHAEQEYLVDGITEELTTELDHIKQFFVPSVTSAMTYKEGKKRLPEIARELDVEVCVGGSVKRSGDLLVVNVRLTDRTDRQVWTQSYERDGRLPHILQLLPHEIARDLVTTLHVQLSPDEQTRLADARTLNPAARDMFLKGLYQLSNASPEKQRENAEELFYQAIQIDPGFAPAYSHLALLSAHGGFYLIGGGRTDRDRTRQMAHKALELDSGLAEAHAALGWVEMSDWDWWSAEEQFQRAIDINPNLRVARAWYAQYLNAMGRNDEAIEHARYAIRLDVASPRSVAHAAQVLMHGGRLDEAIGIYRRLTAASDYWFAHHALGEAYLLKRMYRQAIPELEKAMADRGGDLINSKGLLARAYVGAGEPQRAQQIAVDFESLAKTQRIASYGPVMAYLALGEHERALAWLERAYENHGAMLVMLNLEVFDPIRSHPQFKDLVHRIGLPGPTADGATRGGPPAK